ncbi:hypothetical protein CLM76_17670 [Vreelandella venusta]|nr:hypothetical protein CLM76_17670 [Halomonas hydrothermalis]
MEKRGLFAILKKVEKQFLQVKTDVMYPFIIKTESIHSLMIFTVIRRFFITIVKGYGSYLTQL